jgi:3-methyladenine DNA glycosylase AlkD
MARYGIRPACAYGVAAPVIYRVARALGKDHDLAAHLWASGVLEARAVAALVEQVDRVDSRQMEQWAADFDCWAICDTVCGKLFDRTPLAWSKARAWSRRKPEYVRRAGFALMAWLAVHDKQAPDAQFLAFLPLIERAAGDDRNFVKKAVNWALRQIGKRNARLQAAAIATAERIHAQGTSSARWIASDALRELRRRPVRP